MEAKIAKRLPKAPAETRFFDRAKCQASLTVAAKAIPFFDSCTICAIAIKVAKNKRARLKYATKRIQNS